MTKSEKSVIKFSLSRQKLAEYKGEKRAPCTEMLNSQGMDERVSAASNTNSMDRE